MGEECHNGLQAAQCSRSQRTTEGIAKRADARPLEPPQAEKGRERKRRTNKDGKDPFGYAEFDSQVQGPERHNGVEQEKVQCTAFYTNEIAQGVFAVIASNDTQHTP